MQNKHFHTFYIFTILLIMGLAYISWRMFFTLNLLTSPIATFWSFALLFAEFITLIIFTNFSFLMLKNEDIEEETITNRLQHDYSKDVFVNGELISFKNYLPSVDIFICTYNEPLEVIASTALGAKNIDYPNKNVYILDDGHRKIIKELSEKIGVNYISRELNIGFKAGNINNALKQTNSDLVAIFDADHIALSSFLRETVYSFTDEKLAMVQTPQYFGNLDAIQKNLKMANTLSNEQDMFYKLIEPALSQYGSVFCGGTNIVIRRKYLEAVNNFPQTTITEDSLLGLIFHSNKYKILYYNKPLAIGLAANSFEEYIKQRTRWAKGNLQIIKDYRNWTYYKSLKPLQRFFYITSTLYFLTPIVRLILLFTPVLFLVFDISAMFVVFYQIILFQIVYFALKYLYLFTDKIKPANIIFADIYDVLVSIFTFPAIISTLFLPKKYQNLKFHVTCKKQNSVRCNNYYRTILYAFLGIVLFAEIQGIYDLLYNDLYSIAATCVNLFWNTLNAITLIIALVIVHEKPQNRRFIRINSSKDFEATDCKGTSFNAKLENISLGGMKFETNQTFDTAKTCYSKTHLNSLEIIFYIIASNAEHYRANYIAPLELNNLNSDELYKLDEFIKFAFESKVN